jgi:nucleoside-diphosphate-sugar epimerase
VVSVLVLGGTAWLGGEVARQAVASGHDVTCLARGAAGTAPVGARLMIGDRSTPSAYDAVTNHDWDLVVDVSWQPGFVRSALAALGPRAAHWAYVSSLSVYADNSVPGADESALLLEPLDGDAAAVEEYGPAKVACEQACAEALGEKLLIARAGLIAGYGDKSDRFGYWPWRFDVDHDAAVLVPAPLDAPTQPVNVVDLAAWLLAAGLAGTTVTANVVGEPHTFGEVIDACRAATDHRGGVRAADTDWLADHDVQPWAGPRSLPLWTPGADYAGFSTRNRAAAAAAGLNDAGLDRLVSDALRWERELDPSRVRRAGLTDAEQADLLAALG